MTFRRQVVVAFLFGYGAAYTAACAASSPGPVSPTDPNDGALPGPVPPEQSATEKDCAAACATLSRLGCPEAEAAPGGLTCPELCEQAEESGKFSLKPACVAKAGDVDAVRACGTVRCGKK